MQSKLINSVILTILSRYSIRKFQRKSISKDVQQLLLACGLSAPSGVNLKPCHITVAERSGLFDEMNREIIIQGRKLAEYAPFFLEPEINLLESTALFMLISADPASYWHQYDAGLIAGNINMAAESLGIGVCLLGFAQFLFLGEKKEYFRQRLQVPSGYQPLFGMSLGYKIAESSPPPRPARLDHELRQYVTYLE